MAAACFLLVTATRAQLWVTTTGALHIRVCLFAAAAALLDRLRTGRTVACVTFGLAGVGTNGQRFVAGAGAGGHRVCAAGTDQFVLDEELA